MEVLFLSQTYSILTKLPSAQPTDRGPAIAGFEFESRGESFYAPASIDRGHIVLPVSVCPSACLSAENLTRELNIFL